MPSSKQPTRGGRRRFHDWRAEGEAEFGAWTDPEGERAALVKSRQSLDATLEAGTTETELNRGRRMFASLASFFCWARMRERTVGEAVRGLDPAHVSEYLGHMRTQARTSYSTADVVSGTIRRG